MQENPAPQSSQCDKAVTDIEVFETLIIGTGFSGLLAAIGLQRQNSGSFVLLERSAEPGGTWRDNAYPGAEVDIPTALYSISFIAYPFKKRYAPQSELLAYTRHIIDQFDLGKSIRTHQTVTSLTFDEDLLQWHVEVASGQRYRARFVIDTSGVLANPHIPDIPGASSFQGASFHTGQWDHEVSYQGKRVGVIGSGCSAAQVVPAIAEQVEKLTLFMGRAQWILPRSDRHYGTLERAIRKLPGIRQLNRLIVFAVHEIRFFGFRRYPFTQTLSKLIKLQYARTLKHNLKKYIDDAALRDHMMPDYELGARRVIPTNRYLPALARENVTVDISGIEKITPTGIQTKDGKNVPLDIIVYATGFFAYSNMKKALSFQVNGLDGRNLNAEWEQAAVSYKGVTVSGYPNYFKVNGPNTGTGHSSQISYMEAMVDYVVQAIGAVKNEPSVRAIDAKSDLQDRYMAKMKKQMSSTIWQNTNCTAFYRKNMTGEVTSLSPESVLSFIYSRKWFCLDDYHLLN